MSMIGKETDLQPRLELIQEECEALLRTSADVLKEISAPNDNFIVRNQSAHLNEDRNPC